MAVIHGDVGRELVAGAKLFRWKGVRGRPRWFASIFLYVPASETLHVLAGSRVGRPKLAFLGVDPEREME